ncbi:MAG TPA: hypothetical protein DEG69_10945 [Flavobacteriaceae bacterium]|nr:hypothetical protein [Flavobacteriaceae bacterium]
MTKVNNKDIHIIRQLNDQFRATFRGGEVVKTIGVEHLTPSEYKKLKNSIQSYNSFSNDNQDDHSFGHIFLENQEFYFKIDYYCQKKLKFSDNPADDKNTNRVMTIAKG